jgi:Zn-dependent M28 family amino/carboxypeptidase
MEADSGAGRATGVEVTGGPGAMEIVTAMARPLASLGAAIVSGNGGGVDISPLAWAGVPLLSLAQDTSRYFDWHHSAADTLDKVDPAALAQATGAFAWMAWALADWPETLPRPVAPEREPWWKRPSR